MAIEIQVSYSEEKELQEVIKQLSDLSLHVKRSKNKKGKYNKAYITIKDV